MKKIPARIVKELARRTKNGLWEGLKGLPGHFRDVREEKKKGKSE